MEWKMKTEIRGYAFSYIDCKIAIEKDFKIIEEVKIGKDTINGRCDFENQCWEIFKTL